MSGGGGQTTVQKSDPWSGQQPYLQFGFEQAKNIYNSDRPSYYPGSTVVDYSPETEMALQAQTNRALAGSPITGVSNQLLQNTIQGDYLDPTSRLQPAFDQARQAVDSQFAAGGRYGSGLHKAALGEKFGQIAAGMYDTERNRQMQSMLFAPQAANQDYADISKLAEVGNLRENLQRQYLNDSIDRWNFAQNREADKLAKYMGLIQGNYGGTTSSTGPKPDNTGAYLGAGLMAASLASSAGLFGGGTAAAAGALAL